MINNECFHFHAAKCSDTFHCIIIIRASEIGRPWHIIGWLFCVVWCGELAASLSSGAILCLVRIICFLVFFEASCRTGINVT